MTQRKETFSETGVLNIVYDGQRYSLPLQCNYCAKDRRREAHLSRTLPYDDLIKVIGLAFANAK